MGCKSSDRDYFIKINFQCELFSTNAVWKIAHLEVFQDIQQREKILF